MNERIKQFTVLILAAGVLTLAVGFGILDVPDLTVSDALYQGAEALDGQIVLVGIDQKAIDEIGPTSKWGRDVMARAIDNMNVSEDCRPAAIAVDVLYVGETDADGDEWLAEAAGRYGNVIMACDALYGNDLVKGDDGEYRLDTFSFLRFERAYDALYENSVPGLINTMLDGDGILRHHMLTASLPDGTKVSSMALEAVNMYHKYWGEPEGALPETGSRGFWYLPFCGEPGDFYESISVADVVSGAVPAEYFAGRIVLIGPYAPGFGDGYFTSIDHARQMYGIEVHANAAQALLWEEYKSEVSDRLQLVILFIVLALAFFGCWKRKVLPATLVWAVVSAGWIILCKLLYNKGYVLHVLWIPVCVTVIYVACIAYNYIRAALEKQRVTNTFKRYVDPSVIRELMREGSDSLELGGKMTDISVLFVDIRGFTSMSEVLTPPQIVEILNEYLTLTTKCVMDNHGTLDKFVGDCTMAIWNAPLPQEDYVMDACKAAMAMVEGSKPLAEKLEREFGRTVSFGIGVNAGPAVVGNIGAPMRMDYTAIGDTVNTAARLEANAPGGTVYISRAVADALAGRIKSTSLGDTIKLKGKKDGFEILRLDAIL